MSGNHFLTGGRTSNRSFYFLVLKLLLFTTIVGLVLPALADNKDFRRSSSPWRYKDVPPFPRAEGGIGDPMKAGKLELRKRLDAIAFCEDPYRTSNYPINSEYPDPLSRLSYDR